MSAAKTPRKREQEDNLRKQEDDQGKEWFAQHAIRMWPQLSEFQAGTILSIVMACAWANHCPDRGLKEYFWIDCGTGDFAKRTVDLGGRIVKDDIGDFPAPPVARPRRATAPSPLRLAVNNDVGAR